MELTNRQTHNVAVVEGVASYVVSLGSDGKIASQGKWTRVLQEDAALLKELDVGREEVAADTEDLSQLVDSKPTKIGGSGKGKLVAPEEISQGHVSRATGIPMLFSNVVIGTDTPASQCVLV